MRCGPDVAKALAPYGLAFTSGDTTSVGVGGLLVGGGVGWMARKYGLALDSLVAATVVTADGRILAASAEENPDLFWAIRGGGGNFGVVTSFTVVAQPVKQVFFGQILFAPDETAEVLRGWAAYMASAPEELTTTAMCWPTFGEGAAPVAIMVCYAGDDDAAAALAIDPIRKLGTVVDDQVRLMPYGDVLADINELPPGWRPRVRNRFAPALTDELVTTILAQQAKLANLYVEIRSIGGALNLVAEDATAFAHRDTQALIMGVLLGSPEDNEPLLPTYEEFWSALAPVDVGCLQRLPERHPPGGRRRGVPGRGVPAAGGAEAGVRPGERVPPERERRAGGGGVGRRPEPTETTERRPREPLSGSRDRRRQCGCLNAGSASRRPGRGREEAAVVRPRGCGVPGVRAAVAGDVELAVVVAQEQGRVGRRAQ